MRLRIAGVGTSTSQAAMRPEPSSVGSSCCVTMPCSATDSCTRTCCCCSGGKTSMMRSIVWGVSCVCSVAKTRWPVSAAVSAVWIVSRSRISPTRITSGSWRSAPFSAPARDCAAEPIARWLTMHFWCRCRNSIGSSIVMMCSSRVSLISLISDASVVDLPEPVGPVTSTMPRGRRAKSRMTGGRPSFSIGTVSAGIRRNAAPIVPRWKYAFTRKRAWPGIEYAKSICQSVSRRCRCEELRIAYTISRVSVAVSLGVSSTATSEPRTRSIGGAPAVMWRSDAFLLTTSRRISEKSMFMPIDVSALRGRTCSPVWALARARDAGDLGDRGEAAADLLQPVLAQPHHALVDRRVGDRLRGLAGHGERADRLRHPHHLVEADAALVTRSAAAGAADRLVALEVQPDVEAVGAHDLGGERHALLALLAEQPREPLGDDAVDGRADEEGLDPHLDQAGDRARGVVRVERGEDEVAGERGLDRDLGGLAVADLADHDDVGVGAHHRAQAGREREAGLVVDLDLGEALELVLDRVLDGDDVLVDRVEHVERRIQRRRLARAGRAGDEHRAVRLAERLGEALQRLRQHAELLHADHGLRGVQDAHDDVLAVLGGQGRDAQVDRLAVDDGRDAAVLRDAPLGDVEVGEDLDPRRDGGDHGQRHDRRLLEHAVDAVADPHLLLLRLEVDVGGAALDGLGDHPLHELDDRCVLARRA